MKKPTLLMLIPNLNFGGAQRVFYNLSIELSNNYRVIECVFNLESGHAFQTQNEVVSLEVSAGKTVVDKVWKFFLRCRRLRQIKKKFGVDICISHLEGADIVNVLSKGNEKTVCWVHGSKKFDMNISGPLGFLRHKFFIPFTYKRCDKVVTVSKEIASELTSFYGIPPSRIDTLHNYFDIDDIRLASQAPIPASYDVIFGSKPVIVFSGRLALQKNVLALIDWFAEFRKRKTSSLLILGDGPLHDQCVSLANESGLKVFDASTDPVVQSQADIFFLGFQANPYAFLNRSTLFVLPSNWEGFPMVIGEAMACGLPILSADCPTGPSEMLGGNSARTTYPEFAEFGVLLPLLAPASFEVWNVAFERMLDDDDLRDLYKSRSVVRANEYSKENNKHKVVDLIQSL